MDIALIQTFQGMFTRGISRTVRLALEMDGESDLRQHGLSCIATIPLEIGTVLTQHGYSLEEAVPRSRSKRQDVHP
jgi:hypothetical protein